MNIVPYELPPKAWDPTLKPWWVAATRPFRARTCRKNGIVDIAVRGIEHIRSAVRSGAGVLITPNHPFHYDAYCVVHAADQIRLPLYYMAGWQVFARLGTLGQWSLQSSGCFSVNREGNDTRAFRTAIDLLQSRTNPLAIFPEGEVYHTNDRVTPFREGAAMIGLMAARKADRPIVAIPAAIKQWYTDEPLESLLDMLSTLERRMYWRPRLDMNPIERLYRLAGVLLAVKEVEYLGHPQTGHVNHRLERMLHHILGGHEQFLEIGNASGQIPDRIKEVRRRAIEKLDGVKPDEAHFRPLTHALEDMFLATQLFSYPGNYVAERPTLERFAETIDKLEEDMLNIGFPTPRGRKRVVVQFGQPIELPKDKGPRDQVSQLTAQLESRVQAMLDQLNAEANRPVLASGVSV